MNCIKCGNILSPTDTTCPKCNTQVGQLDNQVNTSNQEVPVLLPDVVTTNTVEETKIQTPLVDQMMTTNIPVVQQPVQPQPQPMPQPQGPVKEEAQQVEELTEEKEVKEESRSKVEMTPMAKTNKQFNFFKAAFLVLLVVVSMGAGVTYGMHSNKVATATKEASLKAGYNVRIGNITYKIPSSFIYTQIENGIEISDENETWIADIGPITVEYADIRTYAKHIKTTYTKAKFKVSDIQTKTLNNREYMTMECTKGGQSILIAFASANSKTTHLIIVKNKDNTIDYKILEEIATVLNNTKTNDNGVEIKTNDTTLDFATINKSIVGTTTTQKRIAAAKAKAKQEQTKE